jgi:ABC-type sugar transport system ATPase subunit
LTGPILEAHSISKTFGKTKVLKNVDFDIEAAEVHALIGENGAGKSTLLKILFGIHKPDAGSGGVLVDGKDAAIHSPKDAIRSGIAMIHQEPLVFKDLTVLENFFTGYIGDITVNWNKLEKQPVPIVKEIGLQAPLSAKMSRLSIAEQQLVEIGAALVSGARIIFMDEPTASLTPTEVDNLLAMIRKLRSEGHSFVYISHRLAEINSIADRVTVLRDGNLVGTFPGSEIKEEDMIRLMLGHELTLKRKTKHSDAVPASYFCAENIGIPGIFENVSFSVGKGEILGFAGLMGSGRTEVARGLFGITPIKEGQLLIDNKPVHIKSSADAIKLGLALLPEDRQGLGLFLPENIAFNATFASPGRITSKMGWIHHNDELSLTKEGCERLQTKYSSMEQAAEELSGGNQQKIGIAKWLATEPDILILDEPTRGIDIGAKEEVYKIIEELAAAGKCVILISSETAEILALSDKVLVMYEGRPAATLSGEDITEVKILSAAHDLEAS